jgi:hypothetical protein
MKIWLFVIICLLFCVPLAQANSTSFHFSQLQSNESLESLTAITLGYTKDKVLVFEQTQIILSNNIVKLNIDNSVDFFQIIIDNSLTNGFDYFGKISAPKTSNTTNEVIIIPSGSSLIEVIDKNGKPILDASVRIDCQKMHGIQGRFITDEFGLVSAIALPTGNCQVRVAYEDYFVSEVITINQGEITQQRIVFEDIKTHRQTFINILLIVLAIILIILSSILIIREKATKAPEKIEEKNNKEEILSVLSKKEVIVLKFMIEVATQEKKDKKKEESEVFVSQTRIVHEAGIPKTSLVRVLNLLETKQLIVVERIGKSKRVYLSSKFLKK